MMRRAGVVAHYMDMLAVDHIAAEILLEVHRRLQRHAEIAGSVVGCEKFLRVVNMEDIAPAPSVMRFKKRGKAYVFEDAVPVQRILEIAQRAGADLWWKTFVG